MTLKRFDKTTCLGQSRSCESIVRINKAGAIAFSKSAIDLMGISESSKVAFYQDDQNTEDWYCITDPDLKDGFQICLGSPKTGEKAIIQNSFLARMILKFDGDQERTKLKCKMIKSDVAIDGHESFLLLTLAGAGKSIIGFAVGNVIPQVYIGAKSKELENDLFIFEEVSEKTDNIFLDDVRANVDFEFFFPVITGKLTVNPKG